jgi:hypothetical protein
MKTGCITGVHRSTEYPVAASQKFLRSGGAFVYLNSSGHVTLALTATATLFGYAVVPLGYVSAGTDTNVWESSATAGADKIPVITGLGNEFLIGADDTVTVAMAGNACDLVGVNDGTAQVADVGTSSTDVLIITRRGLDVGGTATQAVVKLNPAKVQSDT